MPIHTHREKELEGERESEQEEELEEAGGLDCRGVLTARQPDECEEKDSHERSYLYM